MPVEFHLHDMLSGPVPGNFDAFYSLDVLEHITSDKENRFLAHAALSLAPHGVCVVGLPSLESQNYASRFSKMGHVNCKTQSELKKTMARFFEHVFMFSMNDEVVHTGYATMSHYNIALCCGVKPPSAIRQLL
jgi:cyclopropane fatty-acyl-phospholipid synthase-like methyltransferase